MDRRTPSVSDHELFREEALRHRRAPLSREGDVLRLSPSWTRWFFWLLVAVFFGLLLYGWLGFVHEYAEGPALLEMDGRLELTARQPGIVSEVAVRPYQRVATGQLLVRFHDAQEVVELDSAQAEYDLRLIEWLRRPTDPSVRATLAALQARIQRARSRLQERSLRATRGGIVSGVRVRPGQSVAPGQALLALVGEDSEIAVVAMLPGHFRPQLSPGMPLDLEFAGYPNSDQRLTIESIDDDVIGPEAVRRYLGREVADTVAVPDSVVLVRTRFPTARFSAAGRTYSLHDGMRGWVQVRVRTERIVYTLIPGLRSAADRRAD